MILGFAIPSIIAMLLEMVITITDGYFTEYYRIMLFNYPLMVVGTIFGMFIRVDGKPQVCMVVSIAGVNIILDYILVGVLGLGVQGSAIGSLMVQLVKDLILLGYFSGHKAGIILMKYVGAKGVAAFTILGFVAGCLIAVIGYMEIDICFPLKEI